MSYIDLFKHEVLTEDIFGLPLYRALEDIKGDEFKCNQGQLIIGGGGGEHPAIIIKDINNSIQIYLFHKKNLIPWQEYNRYVEYDNLSFYDWSILTYVEFVDILKENGYVEEYPEFWIQFKVVEFILENHPELIDNKWKELLK